MSQSSPAAVKSGLPWWLWTMLIVATVAILAGIVLSSIPDDPEKIYQAALGQVEGYNPVKPDELPLTLDRLREFPEYESKLKFLEGRLASAQRRDVLALELYAEAAKDEAIRPKVMTAIGDSRTRTGDFSGAIEAYEKAVELDPKNANAARIMLGRMYYMLGANHLSEAKLMEVVESDPVNRDARGVLTRICMDFERFDDALKHMSAILSSEGDFSAANPEVLSSYAKALLEVNDQERLRIVSEKHFDLLPDDEVKAGVKIAVGDLEEVRTQFSAAVQEGLSEFPVRLGLAEILLADGDPEQAASIVESAIRIGPRDLTVWKIAARYFAATEQSERLAIAEENVRQLQQIHDDLLAARLSIADDIDNVEGRARVLELFMKLRDFDKARGWYNLVKRMDPTYQVADPMVNEEGDVPLVPFPTDADPVSDDSEKEAPEKEAPEKEAPEKEAPEKEAPEKEAPVKEAPEKEAPEKEAPEKEAPEKEAPEKEAPVKEAPVKEAPVKEAPEKEAPVKEVPVKEVPVKEDA